MMKPKNVYVVGVILAVCIGFFGMTTLSHATDDKIVLKFLHKWVEPENLPYMQEVVKNFEALHPNIKIEAEAVEFIGVTGIPEEDIYGPGGFELIISDNVFSSKDELAIQVLNLEGFPLSKQLSFNTYSDCKKNLVIINFQVEV